MTSSKDTQKHIHMYRLYRRFLPTTSTTSPWAGTRSNISSPVHQSLKGLRNERRYGFTLFHSPRSTHSQTNAIYTFIVPLENPAIFICYLVKCFALTTAQHASVHVGEYARKKLFRNTCEIHTLVKSPRMKANPPSLSLTAFSIRQYETITRSILGADSKTAELATSSTGRHRLHGAKDNECPFIWYILPNPTRHSFECKTRKREIFIVQATDMPCAGLLVKNICSSMGMQSASYKG